MPQRVPSGGFRVRLPTGSVAPGMLRRMGAVGGGELVVLLIVLFVCFTAVPIAMASLAARLARRRRARIARRQNR